MKDLKKMSEDELLEEVNSLETTSPDVINYVKILDELELRRIEAKENIKKAKHANMQAFINDLYPKIVKAINSVYIPNKNCAWLAEFKDYDYDDDIEIDVSDLETFFLSMYSKTNVEKFKEIAYNINIQLQCNNTIILGMSTDDGHYSDDEVIFEYGSSFNNLVHWEIVDSDLLKAF